MNRLLFGFDSRKAPSPLPLLGVASTLRRVKSKAPALQHKRSEYLINKPGGLFLTRRSVDATSSGSCKAGALLLARRSVDATSSGELQSRSFAFSPT
jgi:hypothetical protein